MSLFDQIWQLCRFILPEIPNIIVTFVYFPWSNVLTVRCGWHLFYVNHLCDYSSNMYFEPSISRLAQTFPHLYISMISKALNANHLYDIKYQYVLNLIVVFLCYISSVMWPRQWWQPPHPSATHQSISTMATDRSCDVN